MKWSLKCPEVNSIENVWNNSKQTVNNKRPKNVVGLFQAIRKSWEEISSDVCQKLIDSILSRLRAIIQAKGAATKYRFSLSNIFY